MKESQQTILSEDLNEDEISISDIIRKLWQRRGLLIIMPIIFMLLAVIFLFTSAIRTSTPILYFVQLKGIEKSTYPNGTEFSPQDLLIPEVVARAAESLGLTVDDNFRKSISVEFGSPISAGLHKKYQEKLANKKLSAAEIDRINDEYKQKLQSTSQMGLRITIDHTALGLTADQGIVLANALPRSWSEVFTEKYRVIVDTRLDNVAVVSNDTSNPLQSTADILSARKTLQRLELGVEILNEDQRLKAITSQAGLNGSDLLSRLGQFKEIYFRPIFSGLFSNHDASSESFLIETRLKIAELDRNIKQIDHILSDIKGFSRLSPEKVQTDGRTENLQLTDNTFNQLIELANQASLSEFMQTMFIERRDLVSQKAAMQTDLDRAQANFKMTRKDEFINKAKVEYAFLIKEYTSLLTSARKARRQLYGDFFKPFGSPEKIKTSLLPPKSAMVLALSFFLGIFLAMIVALAWPNRR
ncbi:hypothetical protein DSCO28_08410 [Desulfosarcina ovata subsp. sediminis]|uniref:Polysaccharide chain length determinant N-terminal domain-containing protein n=1 Tax=Desulfosarcina ovata subsp. sediminis TaxID=885957 RepID=A0A5K7ZJ88_9BACT|nr:Wzz/FepE/Etk N-terminal domain-containing protein [Desulfosarcina ovata]BBO80275.1 hypothetical protein DSCO28_08410 [Desulfosarcina ovata subsp. sediminis]